MRKLTSVLASIFAMITLSQAHGNRYANINSYADAFVFDEMGVTFSVYPDGEFDFYLPETQHSTTISNGYMNVTFNSGYDYNPYVQYDDFGAVIQVENVPVWYDHFGRVSQIGDVRISYRNRRVCQVGGLYVYYNRYGHYAYHTGFINTWNPYFVYRPFYAFFARPAINLCFVRTTPYRQYYTPVRYTYYRPYVHNVRPCYATIGHTYRPNGYGQAHHRYTQSPGRGEVAVQRSRRTITTADARPVPSNINRSTMTDQRSAVRSNAQVSNASDRASNVRQATSSSNASRVASPTTESRRTVATQPRTVQSAPVRATGNSIMAPVNTSSRATTPTSVTRGNASSAAVSRPSASTSTRQTAPARSNASSAPARGIASQNVSNSRTTSARTASSVSSRPTVTKPATSAPSRTVTSQPSRSSSSAQTAGRVSSTPSSMNKGSVLKNSSSRRGN